jgi:hypothetical protein
MHGQRLKGLHGLQRLKRLKRLQALVHLRPVRVKVKQGKGMRIRKISGARYL